jgi:hypothetical protein
MTCGEVKLGKETTQFELEGKWQEKCKQLEENYENEQRLCAELAKKNKSLTSSLNKLKLKHNYVKLDLQGPCCYIYSVKDVITGAHAKTRVGIAGIGERSTLDERLKCHRGDDVNMHLEMIVASSSAIIQHLENTIKLIFKKFLLASNHEVYSPALNLDKLLNTVRTQIVLLCQEQSFNYVPDEKIREYNEDIEDTLINPSKL